LWRRVAKVATPHKGHHRQYGSFASNPVATDGRRLYASFGSRGIYGYDPDEKLISPIPHGNKFSRLTDNSMLSSFNTITGEPYYHQKRLPPPCRVTARTRTL